MSIGNTIINDIAAQWHTYTSTTQVRRSETQFEDVGTGGFNYGSGRFEITQGPITAGKQKTTIIPGMAISPGFFEMELDFRVHWQLTDSTLAPLAYYSAYETLVLTFFGGAYVLPAPNTGDYGMADALFLKEIKRPQLDTRKITQTIHAVLNIEFHLI